MTLGFKLGRRLLAAVAVDGEDITFCDSRFVAPRRDRLERGIPKYLDRVLSQIKPSAVFYYAPTSPHSVTENLIGLLNQAAGRNGLIPLPLTKHDIFGSFGLVPLRTRQQLRECLMSFVPQLAEGKPPRQVAVAEAAATALVGEVRCVFRDP